MDVPLPSCIDVAEFTSARLNATEELLDILRQKKGVTKRLFQRLPFEQRRRAQSHNPYRIPRRCRAGVEKDFRVYTPLASKRPRRDRRKVKNLRAVFEARSAKCRWLETHLWHAKRMHMGEKWGFKLALAPTQKSFRKNYRWSKHKSTIYDKSYYSTVKLNGPTTSLLELLKSLRKNSLDPSLVVKESSHYGSFILTDSDGNPIGPTEYLLIGKSNCPGVLVLICHPVIKGSVGARLEELGCGASPFIDTQNIFELYGRQAWRLALRVVKAGGIISFAPDNAIQILKNTSFRVPLVNRTKLVTMNINIPKVLGPFPSILKQSIPSAECDDCTQLNDIDAWEFGMDCPSQPCDKSLMSAFASSRRSTKRKAGLKIVRALPKITAPASIKTRNIKQPLEQLPSSDTANESEQVTSAKARIQVPVLFAFTVCGDIPKIIMITPRNLAGRQLWTLLHKFGGRVMGLENRIKLHLQQQRLHFPEHWPYTQAGLDFSLQSAKIKQRAYDRRPPANRLNHMQCGIEFPFGLSWLGSTRRVSTMILPNMYRHLGIQVIEAVNNLGETDLMLYKFALTMACHCQDVKGVPETDCIISLKGSNEENSGFIVDGGHSLELGYGFGLGYCNAGEWLDTLRQQTKSWKQTLLSRLRPYTQLIDSRPEYLLNQDKLVRMLKVQCRLRHINGKISSSAYLVPFLRI